MCRPVSLIAPHVSFVDSNSIGTSPPHALETIPIGIGPIVLWLSLVLILVLFAADLPADYTGKANVGEKVIGFQWPWQHSATMTFLCYRHSWRSKASQVLIQEGFRGWKHSISSNINAMTEEMVEDQTNISSNINAIMNVNHYLL